jgi:inosose dehydratase
MDFATCLGPTPEASIQWTSALGKPYLWVSGLSPDFEVLCRQANAQVAAAARWGVRVGLHNHMGTPVETQEQLDRFMAACPDCGLILDTAHLAAAGGDPAGSVRRYGDRLVSMHFKDWMVLNPEIGLDRWKERGRFCELGAGNIGLDHHAVLAALAEVGYDGWLFIEQDTHLQDPLVDLAHSREFLRQAGL